MQIPDFSIERYFARYEFNARYLLSASDCDGFSMASVLQLATTDQQSSWQKLALGYTETRGSEFLREAIARHYGTIQPATEVVVTSPGEANFALMNVLIQPGDQVVCMAPMYQSLYEVAQSAGARLSFWQPTQQAAGWYYDPDQLVSLIGPKTRLLVVNFPHNPTGFQPDETDWQAIITIARLHGLVLFSDEMYRLLNHSAYPNLPAACDLYENAVSLWGMAKSFGLAGLRIGWLASHNQALLAKVEAFKDYLSICSSATSEMLATIALENSPFFVDQNLAKIKSNLMVFTDFQKQHADWVSWQRPRAGSTAFVALHLSEPTLSFSEKLVQETGIMLLPGETFSYGNRHARIGFGRADFPVMLDLLGDYLRRYA